MVIKSLSYLRLALIYGIFLLASTGAQAFYQAADEDHPFGLSYDDEVPYALKNDAFFVQFDFEIPEDYYLYKDQLKVKVDQPGVSVSLELPEAQTIFDTFFEKESQVYYNGLGFKAHFKVPVDFAGKEITGTLFYQGCSTEICYRMMKQKLSFAVTSGSSTPVATDDGIEKSFWQKLTTGQVELGKQGVASLIGISLILGFLSSLSVCVLPLIPLTLSFMGVKKGENQKHNIMALIVFVLGLVSMNAPLGLAAAWLGLTLGFQFQNPYFMFGIAAMFLIVALWMLGVFQFQLPSAWQNKVVKVQPKGHMKSYFSGLTIGLLAFACVGPFILPILTFVSASKDLALGMALMVSYSLGMSILFVVAAFFSSAWMRHFGQKSHALKRVVGFFMLIFALYFGWVFVSTHVLPKEITQKQDGFFQTDYKAALAQAEATKRGVLVDFYADWCLPCKQWDLQVWSKKDVQEATLKKFVPVKIDCTTEVPSCQEVADQFKIVGMPTILFIGKDGKEIRRKRVVGIVHSKDEFLQYLQNIE